MPLLFSSLPSPVILQLEIGKVVEKADVKALLGNYLSGGKLRRDSGKVNQERYL